MAVAKLKTRLIRTNRREGIRGVRADLHKAKVVVRPGARVVTDENDYNGMPLEKWKTALKKDVEERFGPTPDDLVPACEAGW